MRAQRAGAAWGRAGAAWGRAGAAWGREPSWRVHTDCPALFQVQAQVQSEAGGEASVPRDPVSGMGVLAGQGQWEEEEEGEGPRSQGRKDGQNPQNGGSQMAGWGQSEPSAGAPQSCSPSAGCS